MFYLIYKVTNNCNGKYYIGAHKTKNKNDGYMGSGKLLKKAIEKYGIENFSKEIIYEASSLEEMFSKEKELVKIEKQSYNLKEGGSGGFDFVNSKGLNNKVNQCSLGGLASNGFTGKTHSDEYKKALSERLKNNTIWVGRKHKEETKKKMSLSAKGKQDGDKNSQFGTMWITNGVKNKKIKKNVVIPDGWYKGRIMESKLIGY